MFLIFPLLILSISILLLYFSYKLKATEKIDALTSDLLKVNEEKTTLEVKYNKILSDVKKQEDLKRGKDLDEMQLLFTKVNMLDDKITFFNTNFKNQLDLITSMLENNMSKAVSIASTPIVDVKEEMSDEFEEFEDKHNELTETIDADTYVENKTDGIVDEEETNDDDSDKVLNQSSDDSFQADSEEEDLDEDSDTESDDDESDIENIEINEIDEDTVTTPNKQQPEIVNDETEDDIQENVIEEDDLKVEPVEEISNNISMAKNLNNTSDDEIEIESTIDDSETNILEDQEINEKNIDNEIKSNTIGTNNIKEVEDTEFKGIDEDLSIDDEDEDEDEEDEEDDDENNNDDSNNDDEESLFDNSASLDVDILSKDFGNDNEEIANDANAMNTALNEGGNITNDIEINSALKELDNINFELNEEEKTEVNNAKIKNNINTAIDNNFDSTLNNLDDDLEEMKNVVESVNMQNIEKQHENDIKTNTEPSMDGSIDDDIDSIDEDFLNSAPLTNDLSSENVSFDIKESIEKLKAQLDNKEDKQE